MTNKFIVHAEAVETFTGKKGEQKTRRLTLLDNSDGARASQFFELNLPAEHAAIGQGKMVTVQIESIPQVFSGRARIIGQLVK
jgi:hypothetical protein